MTAGRFTLDQRDVEHALLRMALAATQTEATVLDGEGRVIDTGALTEGMAPGDDWLARWQPEDRPLLAAALRGAPGSEQSIRTTCADRGTAWRVLLRPMSGVGGEAVVLAHARPATPAALDDARGAAVRNHLHDLTNEIMVLQASIRLLSKAAAASGDAGADRARAVQAESEAVVERVGQAIAGIRRLSARD